MLSKVVKSLFLFGLLLTVCSVIPSQISAVKTNVTACDADINSDTIVDLQDYSLLVNNFLKATFQERADINADGTVDLSDYSLLVRYFLQSCTQASPTPQNPTATPIVTQPGWTQFAGNPQHTSYTAEKVNTPWKYAWQWNGAGVDGKKQASHISVPDIVQPIVGGGRVYMVGGNTLFALNKTNGSVIWSVGNIGTLSSTPAYFNEFVFVGSENGNLYKINASTGTISNQKNIGAIKTAPTIYNGIVYQGTTTGNLVAVNADTMATVWQYAASSPIVSPVSVSVSKNTLIVNSQDLYVHAVDLAAGTRKWRVKPTSRTYSSGNPTSTQAQFEEGWPVIAEKHGIVFVRYRLDWDTLWTWNPYPTTNTAIRQNLISRPDVQALFALNLNDGSVAFIPAVGNGGAGDGGTLPMGPQPVVKQLSDGSEVAYIIWRNGLTCAAGWCDGREDASMGEMVLDNSTVNGYQAGDVRFIKFEDIQTDEMMALSMSDNTIFHSHWLINAAEQITDRSASKGNSFTNPISTSHAPFVIWRQVYCPPSSSSCNPQIFPGGTGTSYGPSNCPFNATTRYCSAGLYAYGDQRSYPPGFYEYHNDNNSGSNPFTVVSDGVVLIKTVDGALIALVNGNPTADAGVSTQVAEAQQSSSVLGEHTTSEPPIINYTEAEKYFGQKVIAEGRIASVVDHRPKAMYLGFKNPHDGALLIRVFEKDLSKFSYDLNSLKGKKVQVSGFVRYYWPEGKDPEIVVTDPAQIKIVE